MARKKYSVLRNCFTAECVYYKKGQVVELPDAMFKDEKNFRQMGEPTPGPEPEPVPEPAPEAPEPVEEPSEEVAKPVVHERIGESLKCSCGHKTYKTERGLREHLAKFNS